MTGDRDLPAARLHDPRQSMRALMRIPCRLLLFGLLLFPSSGVRAQNDLKLAEVPDSKIANLIQVVAPSAACAAVSDVANVLVVGHKVGKEPHLTVFHLDDLGKPNAAPVSLTLPRPASVQVRNYPLSLAPHPKLPLLYVWQDCERPGGIEAPEPAGAKDLDHLLVYRIDRAMPELVQALGRGPEYQPGNAAGAVAVNSAGTKLYVPNLRQVGPKPAQGGSVGYFQIDARGLTVNANAKPGEPIKPRKITADNNYVLGGWPCGLGFVPISNEVVIVGGPWGQASWCEGDRRAPFSFVNLHPYYAAYYVDRLAGHPTLPVFFVSVVSQGWVYRMEHADGIPTLAPQRATLEGAAVHSYPVVMAARNQLVVGGVNKVYTLALDDKGRFKDQRQQMEVANPTVSALTYSPRFDRLYVAVESK